MFLQLLLTISLQLVAIYIKCLPSLLVFTLTHYICSFTETMWRKFRKFQGSGQSRFGSSEKDRYFLKIPKWQYHKLLLNYKRGKLVSNFLNNGPKTCLYGLNISENIEHVFQFKGFFHITSNIHTSCFSTFNRFWRNVILIYVMLTTKAWFLLLSAKFVS